MNLFHKSAININQYLFESRFLFWTWILLCAVCIGGGIYFENSLFSYFPLVLPFALWIYYDYRNVYYLFFLLLPFSIEYTFPNGTSTDLPTEPVMLLNTGLCFVLIAYKWKSLDLRVMFEPITVVLLLHLIWLLTATILSGDHTVSIKYFLAKIWYITPFYFMTVHIVKGNEDVKKLVNMGIWTTLVAILFVLTRHALSGFTFKTSNEVVQPFFRNHVNYASNLVLFLPFVWAKYKWESDGFMKKMLAIIIVIFIVAIYFSYTRAAILSIFIGIGAYYIVQWRWMKPVLLIGVFLSAIGISYLAYNNNYLRYAPNFEKTITQQKFGNLIEATYKMEDISTMERVYRWVAGAEMIKAKTLTGFGPGCFYNFYKAYTVSSFQTYVSDNPDHSTVHCYFLLTFIEQGLPGFLIFITMCLMILVMGEAVYHKLTNRDDKLVLMAALLSFIIVLSINLINDMLETDKVGPFYFLNAAIITIFAMKSGVGFSIFKISRRYKRSQ